MELIQALGGVMIVRWPWIGATTNGRYCTAQGTPTCSLENPSSLRTLNPLNLILVFLMAVTNHLTALETIGAVKQIGNDGAALFTMFLAIMTLLGTVKQSLVFNQGHNIVWGMIAFVCVFWALMTGIPAATIPNFFVSTG
jgi:hypothetical protein